MVQFHKSFVSFLCIDFVYYYVTDVVMTVGALVITSFIISFRFYLYLIGVVMAIKICFFLWVVFFWYFCL